ncbi:MAG: AAA family ATPase [Acidimicrobiia bacterium]|nr:AAA family ATPase [Acidimicrobiia bacterium]
MWAIGGRTRVATIEEEPPRCLTRSLGIHGWSRVDPVLLAALAIEAPVLLVGPHGTAKTLIVERLAAALDLELRHYNASLVNYDDLVGIPLPRRRRRPPFRRHRRCDLGRGVRLLRRADALPSRPAEQALPDRARTQGRRCAPRTPPAPLGGDEPRRARRRRRRDR